MKACLSKTTLLISFIVLLCAVYGDARADAASEKERECARIARMRSLLIGPKEIAVDFKKMMEQTSCVPLQPGVPVGNLETINPQSIVSELSHVPFACSAKIKVMPECIAGVTSIFDENQIRISANDLKSKRFLSVGEGDAGQVDALLENGVDAYGVDFDDSYRKKTETFLQKHPLNYEWGDATKLSKHRLVKVPFDYVTSFCMLCQLGPKSGTTALVEAVRSVKPGGEVRFGTFLHASLPDNPKANAAMLKNAVEILRREGIETEAYSARNDYILEGREGERIMQFIMLKRLPKGQKPTNIQMKCN